MQARFTHINSARRPSTERSALLSNQADIGETLRNYDGQLKSRRPYAVLEDDVSVLPAEISTRYANIFIHQPKVYRSTSHSFDNSVEREARESDAIWTDNYKASILISSGLISHLICDLICVIRRRRFISKREKTTRSLLFIRKTQDHLPRIALCIIISSTH